MVRYLGLSLTMAKISVCCWHEVSKSFISYIGRIFLSFKITFAHPGRTASDGCHYCRTNCAKWGEIEGVRHCHNGGTTTNTDVAPVATQKPSTPKPVIATIKPSTPKPTEASTSTPTIEPEVLDVSDTTEAIASPIVIQAPTPTIEPLVEGTTTKKSGLVDLGLIGLAIYGYMKYRKNKTLQVKNPIE